MSKMLVSPSLDYHLGLLSVLLLVSPAFLLLGVLAARRKLLLDQIGVHLAISAFMLTAFAMVWEAKLGLRHDWNLFAVVGIPVALLSWRSAFHAYPEPDQRRALYAFAMLSLAHTMGFVLSNHAPMG